MLWTAGGAVAVSLLSVMRCDREPTLGVVHLALRDVSSPLRPLPVENLMPTAVLGANRLLGEVAFGTHRVGVKNWTAGHGKGASSRAKVAG
ncbi:hypothetical protein [Streptomyces antimycoticus]|uniref:hypothetical protein n=1 Tax=Streptomyces antimycoticus TaxID=68175 RepID=UPI000A399070|nr:hypothetical protein [Streptomyces antimycoticus]